MAEKQTTGADPHYEETTAPQNPPNSMLTPRARTGWLVSSFGTLVAVFLVVASVFVWVVARESGHDTRRSAEPQAIGTSGVRTPPKATGNELENAPIGARVDLTNVTVDRVEAGTFWVRDGDVTAGVIVPGGMPTVKAGQRVNVSGTVETTGTTIRIRASRIDVK
jgi:uncharacterized protein YdeI (BOF family)